MNGEGEEIISANIWQEVSLRIEDVLEQFPHTLILVHNSAEFDELLFFIKKILWTKQIVYLSMTKTYFSIKQSLQKSKRKIVIIDCVSIGVFGEKRASPMGISDNHITERTPATFGELLALIYKIKNSSNPDYIIIDSLSLFLDFAVASRKMEEFISFINELNKFSMKFIFLYDSGVPRTTINLPVFEVDMVLKLEILRDKMKWLD